MNHERKQRITMKEIVNPEADTITIIANGQPRIVKTSSTIADFLQQLNIGPTHVVAQLNGEIVAKSEFDKAVLQQDCELEIVTMVGGG
jgi:thiamine biosynthesis protein ThiS